MCRVLVGVDLVLFVYMDTTAGSSPSGATCTTTMPPSLQAQPPQRKATVAVAKRPSQHKVPRLPAHQLLRDRIKDRSEVLRKQQRERPPLIRARIEHLGVLREQQRGPYAYRRRCAIDREIQQLEKELAQHESGEFLREYEYKAHPYLELLTAWEQRPKNSTPLRSGQENTVKNGPNVPTWTDQDILDDYMAEVEGTSAAIHVLSADTCPTCEKPMRLSADGSMIMCHTCGFGSPYVDATTAAMAYGDDVEFNSFSYRKYTHWVEWLSKFMYQESGVVPDIIMDNVMRGLEEDGVAPDQVNHQHVNAVLKRLSYRKYYDYLSQITCRITGKPPPKLSPEEVWKLKLLFRAIQTPFELHRPHNRVNFLSCQFVADCLLRMIGREDLLPCLRPLKGKDKRAKQRATMEVILADLHLRLPPSAYTCDDNTGVAVVPAGTKGAAGGRKNGGGRQQQQTLFKRVVGPSSTTDAVAAPPRKKRKQPDTPTRPEDFVSGM